MSNKNATASWSGYSHQGKVGILIALKKINKLDLNIDEDYILDYEQQEDARLLLNGEAIEVHQVKARIDGTSIGVYRSALQHFEPCERENYLHTIVNINNWDDLTEDDNPNNVLRYDYGNEQFFCELTDIKYKIVEEVGLILEASDHEYAGNEDHYELIYNHLLGELDDRIRKEHNNKTYHPHISLNEILELIINNPDEFKSRLYSYREKLYEVFEQYINDLNYNNQEIESDHLTNIRSKIEEIYCLPDQEFEQFLRNINPHTTVGKKISILNIDEFFSSISFSSVFLVVLQDVVDNELIFNTKQVPHYFKENNYVLTTINDDERRMAGHAREVMRNRDVDFSEFETDYLITEGFSGKLAEIVKPNKQIEPDNHQKSDSQKFTSPKEMSFIPKTEAIVKLNK